MTYRTLNVRRELPTYTPSEVSNTEFDGSKKPTAIKKHEWNFDPPALYAVLDGVAKRLEKQSPESTPKAADTPEPVVDFDVDAVALLLDRCLVGRELNLAGIDDEETAWLKALEPHDWLALFQAARVDADEGFRYVEMEADLLACAIRGLELIPGLECVSVWAPQGGGTIDFGNLHGDHLRFNILGTPDRPLDIMARKGVKIEPGFGSNAALKASRVFLRDDNTVSETAIPLGVPEPVKAPASLTPTTHLLGGYGVLRGYLIKALNELKAGPAHIDIAFDARAVADSILRCGSFDEAGAFGFDFRKLDAVGARLVPALPVEAFSGLQEYAAGHSIHAADQVGTDVHWVHLHEGFVINDNLVARLKEFAPLFRLFVSAPKQSSFINLSRLQGNEVLLAEVIVSTPRPLGILLSADAEAIAAAGTPPEAAAKSEVMYVDSQGQVVGEPCPLLLPESAGTPT